MRVMLTTIDNPHSPFDDWDRWDAWDRRAGYHTSSYLARIVRTSEETSESDQLFAMKIAIDEILEFDMQDIYIKVTKEE